MYALILILRLNASFFFRHDLIISDEPLLLLEDRMLASLAAEHRRVGILGIPVAFVFLQKKDIIEKGS